MRALYYYERERRKWIGRREGEGREEEGICRTNVKFLPTPLTCTLKQSITEDRGDLAVNKILNEVTDIINIY